MLTNLHNISSLNNIGKKGQIATLLILMMVAVLIFIMVTVNVGKTSTEATALANAVDAAALSLGSQLATHGNVLREALKTGASSDGEYSEDPPMVCSSGGGWAPIVFAIVLAIICFYAFASVKALAAYAGWGALGGFFAGAALGGEYSGVGSSQGIRQNVKFYATIISGALVGAAGGAVIGVFAGNPALGAGIGALVGAVIGTGTAIYNQSVSMRMAEHAVSTAAKQLSQLPSQDALREDAFYQVLIQIVDDPNDIQDFFDSDDDGDTEEIVSYFQYWWDRRAEKYGEITEQLTMATEDFIEEPLSDFEDVIDTGSDPFLESLYRQETNGIDGSIIELVRALEDSGYDITFWQPGIPPEAPDCDDDVCPEEDYYDEVEAITSELQGFTGLVKVLEEQELGALGLSWHSWIRWFYDPETTWTPDNNEVNSDYYDMSENYIEPKIEDWKSEIEAARDSLDACQINNQTVTNYPCQSSIDEDIDDEFELVLAELNGFIDESEDFRLSAREFYDNMNSIYADLSSAGGANPITYTWADSRGDHSVEVETSSYRFAWVRKKTSGDSMRMKKRVCMVLMDYSGSCWVKATRNDPANKDLGILGKWNPTGLAGEQSFSISRRGIASYSYDYVELSGK
ncbi:hypothetical protein KKD20_06875 [Patescibacteria group bacterium]|nr:hypothetical protein [Candidatus Omnitrophota bacterium]MBU4332797.1 hypothetical protein [Patescibacteria group bacterium]